MKTKKALAGLFGLFGSFPAFFDVLLLAPALLVFNLANSTNNKIEHISTKIRAKLTCEIEISDRIAEIAEYSFTRKRKSKLTWSRFF